MIVRDFLICLLQMYLLEDLEKNMLPYRRENFWGKFLVYFVVALIMLGINHLESSIFNMVMIPVTYMIVSMVVFRGNICAIHVLYDGIDILGCALGGLSTWKLGNVAESYTTSMAGGGNRVISGIIGMVPVTFIVNTNVDRNDIDHPLHLYHRIELTFSTGRLCLVNTHGPVIWLPFLHMPRDEYGTLSINVEEEVNIPSGVTIGNVMLPSVKETFEQIWPDAVKKALEILFKQNRTEKMSMAQYQIYVSKLWSEICQKVGYMNIVDYDNFGDIKSIFYDLEKRHLIKKENDGIE